MTIEHLETMIIGGGQAGLAMGYCLGHLGREYLILERASKIGSSWLDDRWDSFTLVTPNWSIELPGFPYDGAEPDGYLTRAEIAAHLERYATRFSPPIRFETTVTSVIPWASGSGYDIVTDRGRFTARHVVVATSLFQSPRQHPAARHLPPDIVQLAAGAYRNPATLPDGAVFVIGSAQSGAQIAEELCASGRQVYLSVGRAGRLPRRYRGRDAFWWLDQLGFFRQPVASLPQTSARFAANPHLSGKDGGRTLNLHQFARDGVMLLGHLTEIADGAARFAPDLHEQLASTDRAATEFTRNVDSLIERTCMEAPPADIAPPLTNGYAIEPRSTLNLRSADITSVIWATGYQFDFSWLQDAPLDADRYPVHQRGVSPLPGLYFAGLHWLHTRKSGLLMGVGTDAEHLATAMIARAH